MAPEGNGEEILVVDDEKLIAQHLYELLTHYDYQPCIVTDSQEALSIFNQAPDRFSLIITDQTMPNMSGLQLVEKIRHIRPDTPVIICSGYSEDINAESAREKNIVYFAKPANFNALLKQVHRLVNGQAA